MSELNLKVFAVKQRQAVYKKYDAEAIGKVSDSFTPSFVKVENKKQFIVNFIADPSCGSFPAEIRTGSDGSQTAFCYTQGSTGYPYQVAKRPCGYCVWQIQ